MATIMNDRDVLLQSAAARATAGGRYLVLAVNTPFFHVATDGTPTPASITLQATPVNIVGATASFSVSPVGSATIAGTGNTRTLAFSSMSLDSVTVTATVVDNGQMYVASQVISKVEDGAAGRDGTDGTDGTQYATSYLYKWSSTQPSLPTGTATFTWASGANTSYSGTDNWNTSVPTNPGTAGVQLWVAQKQVSAAAGTVTTSVTYTVGAVLSAISQNGATGPQGAPGVKTTRALAYQWSNGAAPTATGSATYTWATGDYNTVPATGWTKTKGNAPSTGYTLYEASVLLVDSSGAATTSIDWSTASISAISYVGTNGSTGSAGSSATIAYTLIDGSSLNTTPATFTASGTNLPTTGTWGETRAWSSTVPTAAAGQSVFQSNGIYNPVANNTVWGIPYMSNFRVGNLSALSTNTGSLTVSGTVSSANGNFTVDSNGNAVMKSITIKDASGNTILSSGTALNPAYAASGTLNSAITIASNGTLSGAGGGAVTISGLGYTGALNATADIALVATGTVTVNGNTAVKSSGSVGWDGQVYSRDSFTGGAFASYVTSDITSTIAFGLNSSSDLTSVDFTGIDYSICLDATLTPIAIKVIESGNQIGGSRGTWASGDAFAVVYDGSSVKYLKNGAVFYTSAASTASTPNQTLFFDSSFFSVGATMKNIRFGPMSSNNWSNIGGTGKPEDNATVGAPSGTFVAGVAASTVATATTNFNASNDRNNAAVTAPTILSDGTAVDHTIRTDGGADISFEWAWSGSEGDIDGFLVYVYQASTNAAYTFGTTPATETVYTVPAAKRAFILFGAAANLFTKFGVRAYRSVDKDINAAGVIMSSIVVPSLTAENPYQPSTSVAFTGNVTGTVNGISAANVNVWSSISGTGKPADNATVGATLGTNVFGQITTGNINSLISSGAIGSTYISDLAATKITAGTFAAGVVYAGSLNASQVAFGTGFTPSGKMFEITSTGEMYSDKVYGGLGSFSDANYSTASILLPCYATYASKAIRVLGPSIAIEAGGHITPNLSNTYTLGASGASWASLYVQNSPIVTSDARTKTDVEDSALGLDFICALRPVSYRYIEGGNKVKDCGPVEGPPKEGEPVPDRLLDITPIEGVRRHYGFIAQEVKEVLGDEDAAIWTLADKDDHDSQQALRYEELIAPLTKAVQQLAAKVAQLEAQLAAKQ